MAGVGTGLVAPGSRRQAVITRLLRFDDPVSDDGRFFRLREAEGLRRRRLVAYRACLLTATACRATTAKIRATFCAEKNSAGEVAPARFARTRPSRPDCRASPPAGAASRPAGAPTSRLAGELVHWQNLRVACGLIAPIATSKSRAPENVVQRGGAQFGVTESVLNAVGGDEVLVVASVPYQRPAGSVRFAEIVRYRRTGEPFFAPGVADPVGEGRRQFQRLEEVAFDGLPIRRTPRMASRRSRA